MPLERSAAFGAWAFPLEVSSTDFTDFTDGPESTIA